MTMLTEMIDALYEDPKNTDFNPICILSRNPMSYDQLTLFKFAGSILLNGRPKTSPEGK